MDTKQPYSSEEEQRELLRQLSESPEEQPRRSVHKSRAAESVSSDAEHGAEGDKAAMGAAKAADEAAEPKSNRKRWTYTIVNYVFKVLTGEIIIVKEVKRFYNYLAYIAVVLLVSIMVLFAALRQDNRRERLEQRVKSLREESIRTREEATHKTSHRYIIERIEKDKLGLVYAEEAWQIVD